MRLEHWLHDGLISIKRIKEKTGAWKVLVPVDKRKDVAGTSLIAYCSKLTNSDGELIDWMLEGILPMYQFVYERNMRHVAVIPRYLNTKTKQKQCMYRITELKDKWLWVEAIGETHKAGKPFVINDFILLYKD